MDSGFGSREEKSQQQTADSSGCAAVNSVKTGTRDRQLRSSEKVVVYGQRPMKDKKRKKVWSSFDKLHDLC
jgi:hypothetical protein